MTRQHKLEEHAAAKGSPILLLQEATGLTARKLQGYTLYGDFAAGTLVGVPRRLDHLVRDVRVDDHMAAVRIGRLVAASAHLLPASSISLTAFEERLDTLAETFTALTGGNGGIGRVLGVDANTTLHMDGGHYVGAAVVQLAAGARRNEGVRRARWTSWLCSQGFTATNTFCPRAINTWHRWRGRARGRRARGRARVHAGREDAAQIDFVLVGGPVVGEARVTKRTPFKSDHRAVHFTGELALPHGGPAPEARQRRLHGWRPKDAAAEQEYQCRAERAAMRAKTPHELCQLIAEAAAAVPHLAGHTGSYRKADTAERDARRRWKSAITAEQRVAAGREYRRLRQQRWRAGAAVRALEKPVPVPPTAMTTREGLRTLDRGVWDAERGLYARELFAAARGRGFNEQQLARAGIATAKAVAVGSAREEPKIELAEWFRALGGLAGGSRVGTDGVSPLMLRLAPWRVKVRLAELFSQVRAEEYPAQWKRVELVPIAKEAARAPTSAQLRYLGLGPLGGKLFTAALVSQLPSLPGWHVGYTPGGRTTDIIGLVRAALFGAASWSDPQFSCVVLSCDVK